MSRPPRNFHQDLADSLVAEAHPAVIAGLKANYPGLLKIHRAHPDNDRLGVDLLLELEGARVTRVDVKIRKTDFGAKRNGPPDVVLEIDVGGRPGWSMKETKADSILIVYLDSGRSVSFDAKTLRLATKANHAAWLKRYQLVDPATQFRSGRPAVPSIAVAVPADILQAAIDQLHVPRMPDDFDAAAYAFEHDAWELLMAAAFEFEFVRVKSLSAKTTGASSTDAVIQVCAAHNLRQGHCHSRDKKSGPIDSARSHMNVILRGCDKAADVAQMARDLVRVGGWQKDYERANAAVAGELVFSLPANTQLDVIAFFCACIAWAEQFFDAPVLSAVVHLDQAQPHLHLICLAVRRGQWRGGRFFGDRDAVKEMRADFHTAVGKPHGLRRQQQSSESAAIRHATAMREFDAIMAHQDCLNNPLVVQALVSLIAADPERLRAAREHAMADEMPIALPNMAASVDKTQVLSCVALSHGDAFIDTADVIDAGQDSDGGELPNRIVRIRDTDLPADYWNPETGEHALPPPPPPSAQQQALRDIRAILGMRQRRQDGQQVDVVLELMAAAA